MLNWALIDDARIVAIVIISVVFLAWLVIIRTQFLEVGKLSSILAGSHLVWNEESETARSWECIACLKPYVT